MDDSSAQEALVWAANFESRGQVDEEETDTAKETALKFEFEERLKARKMALARPFCCELH